MKDPNVFVLVLALLGLILGAIGVVMTKFVDVVPWAVVAVSTGLALAAWPG
jgi:hypothetical protein